MEIKFGSFRIWYNDPHDIAAIIESYVLNVYRIRKIKGRSVVLDIGAGIGEFSLLASSKVGAEGKVIAIEPSPDDFKTLQINIKENGCRNVMRVIIPYSKTSKLYFHLFPHYFGKCTTGIFTFYFWTVIDFILK